jgi:hypothetical protein
MIRNRPRYRFDPFFSFLPLAFCHSFSRRSISALGTTTTAWKRLVHLLEGCTARPTLTSKRVAKEAHPQPPSQNQ